MSALMVAPSDKMKVEDALKRLHDLIDEMRMLPGVSAVRKDLADIYEKVKADYERQEKKDPE